MKPILTPLKIMEEEKPAPPSIGTNGSSKAFNFPDSAKRPRDYEVLNPRIKPKT